MKTCPLLTKNSLMTIFCKSRCLYVSRSLQARSAISQCRGASKVTLVLGWSIILMYAQGWYFYRKSRKCIVTNQTQPTFLFTNRQCTETQSLKTCGYTSLFNAYTLSELATPSGIGKDWNMNGKFLMGKSSRNNKKNRREICHKHQIKSCM